MEAFPFLDILALGEEVNITMLHSEYPFQVIFVTFIQVYVKAAAPQSASLSCTAQEDSRFWKCKQELQMGFIFSLSSAPCPIFCAQTKAFQSLTICKPLKCQFPFEPAIVAYSPRNPFLQIPECSPKAAFQFGGNCLISTSLFARFEPKASNR